MQFFEGKGYSQQFVENMYQRLDELSRPDTQVRLTGGCDDLCAACPNAVSGVCTDSEKVSRYDRKVLAACSLTGGELIPADSIMQYVSHITSDRGRLSAICGDCRWFGICGGKMTSS